MQIPFEKLNENIEAIRAGTLDGCSFLANGESVSPRTGYLVTVACVDVPRVALELPLVLNLMMGLCHRSDRAGARVDCFGMFSYGDGYVSVDANQNHQQLAPALELARKHSQVAIWDCARSVAIDVAKEWPVVEAGLVKARLAVARDRHEQAALADALAAHERQVEEVSLAELSAQVEAARERMRAATEANPNEGSPDDYDDVDAPKTQAQQAEDDAVREYWQLLNQYDRRTGKLRS